MIPGDVRKEMQIIKHINPPWKPGGFTYSSTLPKSLAVGRGDTEEDSVANLWKIINNEGFRSEEN